MDTYSLNYTGDNLVPGSVTADGTNYTINYNSANQFISVTHLPDAPIETYSYFNGLIVGFTDFQNNTYSVDSIAINTDANVTTVVLGANFSLDSLNHHTYDRIGLWQYTYSDIANPIYANKSASLVLFLATSFIQSKNISAGLESISYGPNFTILSDEVYTFQNTVDANQLIQASFSPEYGDLIKWSYY
jgi:alanine racemase